MAIKTTSFLQSRRQFLFNVLPVGTLLCLGCSNLLALVQSEGKLKVSSDKHKFLEDSGMTFKDVYSFAFQGHFIPIMQNLANVIGKDKFIEILKKASSEAGAQNMKNMIKNLPKKDLATLASFMTANPIFKKVLTYEIVEESDKAFEIKVTECLWAKTFRDANALEIGYASICHPDFASARTYNPKIKMIRTKTLMQGHDCCNHRYVR